MGIALSTLSAALPHSLQKLSRWLHNLVRLDEAPRAGAPASSPPASANPPGEHGTPGHGGPAGDQRSAGSPRLRPLRGNWPFTVQPAPPEPKASAARTSVAANRSFLSAPCGSSRDAFMASIASSALPPRPVPAVRKVSHASGRLVIAGRMADVCAELDRMAACEALQA
ncbi:hypothetical protein [Acidovorax sp. LjRoot117]|uniref:hypothetical protein n=1 Tax=Acidovorax sp. LjRoot117 TaxID=3342255 RepID=UPI003ECFDE89